jgi:hypothetical protein
MQKVNLRTGLLAGATVLALGGCSFFHHRDDRADSASARPKIEQHGSSQQAAANNQPAQGNDGTGTGASAPPSGNGNARGAAHAGNSYADRGAGVPRSGAAANPPTRAGTPYAENSPSANGNDAEGDGRASASKSGYANGAQGTSGSTYPNSAPGNRSTGGSGSPHANGAAGAASSGMSGSGSTVAPTQRAPSAMNDATSPDGAPGDNSAPMRGAAAGATPSTANRVQPANGAQQGTGTTSPTQAEGAEASGAPHPLVQNNTRNQMQNQLQNQTGLVDVNLNNVKVDVAKNLNIDASKIPVTVQLPVTAAANVCGVDVNALAAQKQQGGGTPSCMANNANEATQAVQTSVQ